MPRSSAEDRFDLNDVKGLWKSRGIEKGKLQHTDGTLGHASGFFFHCLFYKVLEIHALSEF